MLCPLHCICNLLLSVGSSISTWSPISKRWYWPSYHIVSCNDSGTSVILPGPASANLSDAQDHSRSSDLTSTTQLEWTESFQLWNFSVGKQNRVDQSVPLLWLVLTEPIEHGLQCSIPSHNKSIANGMVWHTGKTLYTA